ncbi:MAG: TrbG/VirB9 family P-type conjugative transfer protein [Candidatus Binataceae bacterium]|jgi:type IV secretion system protein VirB9
MNHHHLFAAFLTCLLHVGTSASAIAQMQVSAHSDHRIRSMLYVPDQVVRLRGWVGYHVDLEFEPGESFVTLGGGDLAGLTYGAYGNHLVLKPKAPTVRTNLTVFTNKRTYVIDYAVSAGRPDVFADELVYSLRFSYPPIAVPAPAEQIAEDLAASPGARFQNMEYWYCGNSLLQPVAASDDGVHTRLRFGPSAELPAIFVRSDDGTESLLNYSMEGRDMVIHRLARHFILRRGKLVGCVTNKGFIGSGERLESGTVSPQVHRQTRQLGP